jgi:hypothetical protein
MPETVCQQAIERVMTYLRDDGVELDAVTCRQVLRLVDSAMKDGGGLDLPARCIELVPDYFNLPGMDIPAPIPPLMRGHLGYYPHD